ADARGGGAGGASSTVSKRSSGAVFTSAPRPPSIRANKSAAPAAGISTSPLSVLRSSDATYCAPRQRRATRDSLAFLLRVTTRRQIPSESRRKVHVAVWAA